MTLLYVEDNEDVRKTMTKILSRYDCRLLVASNGQEALEVIGEEDIDLLLTDYHMPKMNGKDLADILKERFPDLEVLIISAYQADDIGDYEFWVKPLNVSKFRRRIKKFKEDCKQKADL